MRRMCASGIANDVRANSRIAKSVSQASRPPALPCLKGLTRGSLLRFGRNVAPGRGRRTSRRMGGTAGPASAPADDLHDRRVSAEADLVAVAKLTLAVEADVLLVHERAVRRA